VGRATARRLSDGFGARVQAYDPGIRHEDWPSGILRAQSLNDILKSSQILFLHAPLLPSTRNIIDAAALNVMPKGSYLVNCARGGVVDEPALAAALLSGHLAGAASDVFAVEPPEPDELLDLYRHAPCRRSDQRRIAACRPVDRRTGSFKPGSPSIASSAFITSIIQGD
jgi:D-3-phosphoglycerate dehydrogenase / 2-oxoglutarate reductase